MGKKSINNEYKRRFVANIVPSILQFCVFLFSFFMATEEGFPKLIIVTYKDKDI
jgi:hypothetical protein